MILKRILGHPSRNIVLEFSASILVMLVCLFPGLGL